ncbi:MULTISPECIES: hypothetical protein [Aeromonas]|uniref:hypothetical protein n=1 Tax=Aeromonas TaxID=642 RepID=UPI000361F2B4|nr:MULTISPECIES: hypothetical protein [Aeromonas]MBL0603815.1 hypothetical protein [Aeromonas dhakensis]MBW3732458.1 hypothetical protein [Aeromonas dhakensis]QSR57021.1 hypothetical protein GO601_17150 [Aeromonas dhakensis]
MLEQKKKVGRKGVSKEVAQEMLALSNQNYTLESIGKKFNLNKSSVSRTIQRLKDGKYD